MKKLILIDGNAILHRAYHALPALTNREGVIVNAVYGFFSMFLKIMDDQKPDFLVVCFDRPKPTFRKELFVGYQAKRPRMSDDLVPQIKFVHEVLEKAKVVTFEIDGYEADDLIGTLARQAVRNTQNTQKARGSDKSDNQKLGKSDSSDSQTIRPSELSEYSEMEVVIVSGDRDLLQLVNSHVKMIAPVTGLTNMIVYDSEKVKGKFGIKPAQMVDYKALVGDASDNYPGVAGVGPKTAAGLLNEYNNLENIYKNIEKIKKKNERLGIKLAEGAESAGLAQKLAEIVKDAPITLDIEKCGIESLDKEGLKEEFEKFGFKSLLKRLEGKKEDKLEKQKKKGEQLGLI